MKAGHELDELVATKVMGWTPSPPMGGSRFATALAPGWNTSDGRRVDQLPKFSAEIAAAKTVESKIQELDLWPPYFRAVLALTPEVPRGEVERGVRTVNTIELIPANRSPETICLAALKAVGHDPL